MVSCGEQMIIVDMLTFMKYKWNGKEKLQKLVWWKVKMMSRNMEGIIRRNANLRFSIVTMCWVAIIFFEWGIVKNLVQKLLLQDTSCLFPNLKIVLDCNRFIYQQNQLNKKNILQKPARQGLVWSNQTAVTFANLIDFI